MSNFQLSGFIFLSTKNSAKEKATKQTPYSECNSTEAMNF